MSNPRLRADPENDENHDEETPHQLHRPTNLSRAIPLSGLIISSLASCLLFVAARGQWHTSGPLLRITTQHRASVQIVVHMISGFLGTCQVLVICALLRWHLNIRAASQAIRLDSLGLWTAMCGRSFDFSLQKRQLGILVAVLAAFEILGLLWAGSTTPVMTTTCWDNISTRVARYSQDSAQFYNISCSGCEYNSTYSTMAQGLFGWVPWSSMLFSPYVSC
jgi:hypothetical protein